MPLTITFLGHAGFLLGDGTHTLAIDPFLTDNPLAKHTPGDIRCDTIALTHGHSDHVGDTVAIAAANGATVMASFELCNFLTEQGVEKTEMANPGGRVETDFGHVAFTPAIHSSSYEGRYMGAACGLVVEMGGHSVYHAGDTALFSDMRLIGDVVRPTVAFLPIGDRVTMGPELASLAAEYVGPKYAVPIHYKTWPILIDNAGDFKPEGVEVKEMEPGEAWTLD